MKYSLGISNFLAEISSLSHSVVSLYFLISKAEEAEVEQFYEDLQDLLEVTPKKDVLLIIGDRNAKVGSQEIPGETDVWLWYTK